MPNAGRDLLPIRIGNSLRPVGFRVPVHHHCSAFNSEFISLVQHALQGDGAVAYRDGLHAHKHVGSVVGFSNEVDFQGCQGKVTHSAGRIDILY
jgi:hypothetical protein